MAVSTPWTRDQLLVAFTLYSRLPFGKLHSRNPEIIDYAKLIGRTPSALAMKLVNIASLDPVIIDSGRTGLSQASKADRELWQELERDPQAFEQQCQQAVTALTAPDDTSQHALEAAPPDYYGHERMAITTVRVGQQQFRKRVLKAYDERCCITGLEEPILLIASHIRPWKDIAEHRLDPSNGLCLSALHDKAFDKGLIGFNDHLELMLSPRLKMLSSEIVQNQFEQYEGKQLHLPTDPHHHPKLEHIRHHRKHLFGKHEQM
ncbi:HNH endonuclease [Dickeya oryzae]|uniref:HNH endonuclease n=1 Tax=Dickeya oryzae TaxID=1240404 RepID=A0ABS5B980_9GAMM|nr:MULTISPECIES: HNH endonuclease [Dickeya]AJC64989.1 restriction endonuclease [Dickeya zeae EC1]MBP2856932.1 HNH endonuclease [Dickeya oryzae]